MGWDNPGMYLNYLIFDTSDDCEGTGTWEAMASVCAADVPAVLAECRPCWPGPGNTALDLAARWMSG